MYTYIVGALLRMYRELQVTGKTLWTRHMYDYTCYVCVYTYTNIHIHIYRAIMQDVQCSMADVRGGYG